MLNFRYFDAWLKNTRDGTCNRSQQGECNIEIQAKRSAFICKTLCLTPCLSCSAVAVVLFLLALYPHDPSAELYTTDAEFIDEPETRAP